jgi:hypothetical protein
MARRFARFTTDLNLDEDWRILLPREQWLFFILCIQPNLSLVGCMDYRPQKLAVLSAGDRATVEAAADGLERSRYVCIDRETEEILIRSFTRHDGIQVANGKLRKGFWSAYRQVASAGLRKVAVDNMPEELFHPDFEDGIPGEAVRFRRSERMDWRIESNPAERMDERNDSPPCLPASLPPTDLHPPVAESVERIVTADDYRRDDETTQRAKAAARRVREERFRAGGVVPITATSGAARALGGNRQ